GAVGPAGRLRPLERRPRVRAPAGRGGAGDPPGVPAHHGPGPAPAARPTQPWHGPPGSPPFLSVLPFALSAPPQPASVAGAANEDTAGEGPEGEEAQHR